MKSGMRLAQRAEDIQAFHVMDILARARQLEAAGRDIVHMEIGEPDFTAPPAVVEAGMAALREGRTHYTQALGLPVLRQAIAHYYGQRYGLRLSSGRVAVTPGASGALLLALAVLLNPGEQVLMADPGYPCNRHFVRLLEGEAVALPVDAASAWQPTAAQIEAAWGPRSRVVLLASPSNPGGTLLEAAELRRIVERVSALGGVVVMDEIYHGLVYDAPPSTALGLSEEVFVINSFSKYFAMTGWRLGWLVAPEGAMPALDRLAQNLFLAPSTPAQHAALAAFAPESLAILEARREAFRCRRDYLLPALEGLGFRIGAKPGGAFYVYADCSAFSNDSFGFCRRLLEEAGVAVTPGCDFGEHGADRHVRFAYTTTLPRLEEGVRRMAEFLRHG
ncbi:MAG TPA: pyridoxal phosphate-dependent aminotransferase [Gammaproteobacteria bacterium]|nr:pyridoxal phosphate-dependent aminotransferase [Gammaproteobacteria bacterium]